MRPALLVSHWAKAMRVVVGHDDDRVLVVLGEPGILPGEVLALDEALAVEPEPPDVPFSASVR